MAMINISATRADKPTFLCSPTRDYYTISEQSIVLVLVLVCFSMCQAGIYSSQVHISTSDIYLIFRHVRHDISVCNWQNAQTSTDNAEVAAKTVASQPRNRVMELKGDETLHCTAPTAASCIRRSVLYLP